MVTDDVLWRRDGTALPVEYAAVPVADAEDDLAVMIVFRDITERRRTSEALQLDGAQAAEQRRTTGTGRPKRDETGL